MDENLLTKITAMSANELLNIIENKVHYEADAVELAKARLKSMNQANYKAVGVESGITRSQQADDNCSNVTNVSKQAENEGCLQGIKSTFKTVTALAEVIIAIIVICLLITGKFSLVLSDIMAAVDKKDNSYVEMVQNLQPFENGTTYYTAFSNTFDRSDWEYLKVDGQRYVQVTSYYNDINDKMITQFTVTPTDEKDQFKIETYAMRVSGEDLSKLEMSIVLANIFKGDVVERFGELLLY